MPSLASFALTPEHPVADYQVSGAINFTTARALVEQTKQIYTKVESENNGQIKSGGKQRNNDTDAYDVIDMSDIAECNSAAVAWLLELQRFTGKSLSLLNPPQQINDILALSGLTDMFPVYTPEKG